MSAIQIFTDLFFLGSTISMIGNVMLGVSVILVHAKIIHEHKIDGKVLSGMKHERYVAIFAIVLIIIGYIVELLDHGYIA